jgi:hypothetical protein
MVRSRIGSACPVQGSCKAKLVEWRVSMESRGQISTGEGDGVDEDVFKGSSRLTSKSEGVRNARCSKIVLMSETST